MSEEKTYKNTFAPDCDNEKFTVGMIIRGLFWSLWEYDDLPDEIQDVVDAEMLRRFPQKGK